MIKHSEVKTLMFMKSGELDTKIKEEIEKFEQKGYELKNISITSIGHYNLEYTVALHFQEV